MKLSCCLFSIAILLNNIGYGQTKAISVQDINPGTNSSYPNYITQAGNLFYFLADDGVHGYELWRSDGTLTQLVSDINPGAGSSNAGYFYSEGTTSGNMVVVNGTLFFTADDGTHGIELWKINSLGVAEMVKDISPGEESGLDPIGEESYHINLVQVNSTTTKLFFSATDGVHGHELWVSDGTNSGTVMLEINKQEYNGAGSLPKYLTAVDDIIYFSATDEVHGRELWQSDGTPGGTKLVRNINPNTTYISKTDTVGADSNPQNLYNANGTLYFSSDEGETWTGSTWKGTGNELWKYEPVSKSTSLVADINSGLSSSNPANFKVGMGKLFFTANAGSGNELWSLLLAGGGPALVKDINASGGSNPSYLTVLNQKLFFNADDGIHGKELWMSDGTPNGTLMRKDIEPGINSGNPRNLTAIGTTSLYFTADDGVTGTEIWETNETTLPFLVDDIFPGLIGSNPVSLTNISGTLYFGANNQQEGFELMTFIANSNTSGIFTIANGNWNSPSVWHGGVIPVATSAVNIKHSITVTANAACLSVKVEKTGALALLKGVKLLLKN